MADAPVPPELSPEQVSATMRSKPYLALLLIAAVVGVLVSLAAWCFLELVYQIQQEVFTHLPHALGYSHGPPVWWPLPVLAIAALIVAVVIVRLPGRGGHIPANGLAAGGAPALVDLPGIVLAGLATLGLGLVLGPETPLIALGAGLGLLTIRLARRDLPPQVLVVVAAAGSFAALSFVFSSPLIAAVILIEATGIGGAKLPLVLVPGLLAAGIGTLVSVGMGSFTGLSSSAYALGALPLPAFGHPDLGDLGWSIALAIVVAVLARVIMRGGLTTYRIVTPRPVLLLPLGGLIIAGLVILFSQVTNKSIDDVLFSGQDQLPGLIAHAGTYSLGALALLIACKGIAYMISLGSFRGGPTFPAMFLGAAGGIMASRLPGFPITAAVAVGMAAAIVGVLKLPLTAVVIGTVLTSKSGLGVGPLIIVAAVVAYIVMLVVDARWPASQTTATEEPQPTPATITADASSHTPAPAA
jgi:chloride channel protein, CIC family